MSIAVLSFVKNAGVNGLHSNNKFNHLEVPAKKIGDYNPDSASSHFMLGVIKKKTNQISDALFHYQRAIQIQPDMAEAYNNMGAIFDENKDWKKAITCFLKAVEIRPDFIEAYNNLASLHIKKKELDSAIFYYFKILEINPVFPSIYIKIGDVFLDKNSPQKAITSYFKAIEQDPDYAAAYFKIGIVLKKQKNLDNAVSFFKKALKIASTSNKYDEKFNAELFNTLGNVYMQKSNFQKAISCFNRALTLFPDFIDAHLNLGETLGVQKLYPAAISQIQQALKIDPENAESHFRLAVQFLESGNYSKGWKEYEWRLKIKKYRKDYLYLEKTTWDGTSFHDKQLLIFSEQGMGDIFQFIRYLPIVKKKGGYIKFEIPKALFPIFENFSGIDELVAKPDNKRDMNTADIYISLLSLPFLLKTTVETIPAQIPYLFADKKLITKWKSRLLNFSGYKIGICWQGNPAYGSDQFRSIPLHYFYKIAGIKEITLVSLQKYHGIEQLNDLPENIKIVDPGSKLDKNGNAFMDTAAVMQNLDLIITSDTSIAHLAGALGVPVWTILSYAPEWRWGHKDVISPWYPTMRLFRQKNPGDWDSVFQLLCKEIKHLLINNH